MKYVFFYIVSLWFWIIPAYSQDESRDTTGDGIYAEEERYRSGDDTIKDNWGFTIQVSTDGFILGGLYDKKIARCTHLGLSLDMFWVKGKDEMVDWTGQTLNGETILILPLTLNLKRRLFPEDIINSFRPFIVIGAGAVYGYYISGDVSKSSDSKDSQYAPTGFIGLGAEFGKPGRSGYGMDMRYQILRFPSSLGQRSKFDNYQIGFHMTLAN
jgi:hypothetical protein